MINPSPKCFVTILDLQWSGIVEEKEIIRNFALQYIIATVSRTVEMNATNTQFSRNILFLGPYAYSI